MSLNQIINPVKRLDIKCGEINFESLVSENPVTIDELEFKAQNDEVINLSSLPNNGVGGNVLTSNGDGTVSWTAGGTGGGVNYNGVVPVTVGKLAIYGATDGLLIKDSSVSETDITTLQTDVGTLQTDVGTLQTDVGTLQTKTQYQSSTLNNTTFSQALTSENFKARNISSVDDSTVFFLNEINMSGYNIENINGIRAQGVQFSFLNSYTNSDVTFSFPGASPGSFITPRIKTNSISSVTGNIALNNNIVGTPTNTVSVTGLSSVSAGSLASTGDISSGSYPSINGAISTLYTNTNGITSTIAATVLSKKIVFGPTKNTIENCSDIYIDRIFSSTAFPANNIILYSNIVGDNGPPSISGINNMSTNIVTSNSINNNGTIASNNVLTNSIPARTTPSILVSSNLDFNNTTTLLNIGAINGIRPSGGVYSESPNTPLAGVQTNVNLFGLGTPFGSATVPQFTFKAGDCYSLKIGGEITCAINDIFSLSLEAVGLSPCVFGTFTIDVDSPRNNDWWELEVEFIVRAIGGTNVASMSTNGNFTYINNNDIYKGKAINTTQNTNFSTLVDNTIALKYTTTETSITSFLVSQLSITKLF